MLAIALLMLFSFTLVAPLLASDVVNASLPACCRRTGQHHCATPGDSASQRGTTFSIVAEKCPCPPAVPATVHLTTYAAPANSAIFAELVSHPAIHAQAEARYRISFDRSRQKRGPPSLILL